MFENVLSVTFPSLIDYIKYCNPDPNNGFQSETLEGRDIWLTIQFPYLELYYGYGVFEEILARLADFDFGAARASIIAEEFVRFHEPGYIFCSFSCWGDALCFDAKYSDEMPPHQFASVEQPFWTIVQLTLAESLGMSVTLQNWIIPTGRDTSFGDLSSMRQVEGELFLPSIGLTDWGKFLSDLEEVEEAEYDPHTLPGVLYYLGLLDYLYRYRNPRGLSGSAIWTELRGINPFPKGRHLNKFVSHFINSKVGK